MPEEEEPSSRPRFTPLSGTEADAAGSCNGIDVVSLAVIGPDPDTDDPADPVAAPDPAPDPDGDPDTGSAEADAADVADAAGCTPSGSDGG